MTPRAMTWKAVSLAAISVILLSQVTRLSVCDLAIPISGVPSHSLVPAHEEYVAAPIEDYIISHAKELGYHIRERSHRDVRSGVSRVTMTFTTISTLSKRVWKPIITT